MGLAEDVGGGPVGIDTSIFIYWIEEHAGYAPVLKPLFAGMSSGRLQGVTSGVTLLETLVVPLRAGNRGLADRYEAFLTRSRGLRMIDLDRGMLRAGAELRAAFRVKTPDALQIAAALRGECRVYLTNDRSLPVVPGLSILQLKRYLHA